ncbi:MAG: T9SS type A sorting domain-containing protein [Chitinophagaceae bacterium]
MRKALEANGYTVDVRSASNLPTAFYMIPSGTDIIATANSLTGSSYNDFIFKFNDLTGSAWQQAWNTMPAFENVNGAIQNVASMQNYDALIVVGGLGALDYRVDGTYNTQGVGARLLSAATIQAAALKLNSLAIEALLAGKPVLTQCHGASLAPFWRIPGTFGSGAEALGFSLLKNQPATGFPEQQTATDYASLQVTYRPEDRVCIASPHESLAHNGNATSKVITTRDWYPQTILHAAQTLLNIMSTYPAKAAQEAEVKVLVLHGGAVDINNCAASNRNNDIPCNYGTGVNLPADHTDIVNLLNANSNNDNFQFTVTHLNLNGVLPFNNTNQAAVLSYLQQFHTVVFFKHWSTGVTNALQNALVQFADAGGGVVGLHHALYNDIDGSWNKNILVNQLFGVQSAMNTWSASRTNLQLLSTNLGHFVSSFGINYAPAVPTPGAWLGTNLPLSANISFSNYPVISVFDELYNNMQFVAGQTFGKGVNQITPLFSNNQLPSAQVHTSGFVKLFNPSADGTVGRVVYFIAGESKQSFNIITSAYAQAVRNAVVWSANRTAASLPIKLQQFTVSCNNNAFKLEWVTAQEINSDYFTIENSEDGQIWQDVAKVNAVGNSNTAQFYSYLLHTTTNKQYYFRLRNTDKDGTISYSTIKAANCKNQQTDIKIAPNPVQNQLNIYSNVLSAGNVIVKIMHTNGLVVYSSKETAISNKLTIRLPYLSKGVYWLSLTTNSNNLVQKFLKE